MYGLRLTKIISIFKLKHKLQKLHRSSFKKSINKFLFYTDKVTKNERERENDHNNKKKANCCSCKRPKRSMALSRGWRQSAKGLFLMTSSGKSGFLFYADCDYKTITGSCKIEVNKANYNTLILLLSRQKH